MRVSCPNCAAAYEIPDAVLALAARRLRCARCDHEWTPELPSRLPRADSAEPPPSFIAASPAVTSAPAATPAPLVATPPLTADRAPVVRTDRRATRLTVIAWALSLLVLVGLAVSGYLFRDQVKSAWPPSRLVYAALGLG